MPEQSQPIDFLVRINGTKLPDAARRAMQAITVHEDLAAASMFTLELRNWDDDTVQFTWSDDDLFVPGGEVEISLGYVDDVAKVMVGEITSLEPVFMAGDYRVIVRGYDHRHRLLRGRKTRSFTQTKDSDIAKEIAREAGLGVQATATQVALEYVLQHNQTDLAFLQERARRIGYEVFVKNKTLYFRQRKNTTSAALTLAVEQDILELYPRLSTMAQVGEVVVQGWDVRKKESIVSTAKVGDEATKMGGKTSGPKAANTAFGPASTATVNRPVFTQAEADQMAAGRFNEVAMAYINGEGLCYGRYDLEAGTNIEIAGAGTRFSGIHYVTSVRHIMRLRRGYRTRFTYQRNAN